ncbi:MAG: KilA-N domain-containing protein [Candidatus Methylumidiphilus sp.]
MTAKHTTASNIIRLDYQGLAVGFTPDGWFNATAAAERFGKRPVDWLALDSTKEYIESLADMLRSEKSSLLTVKRGGRGKSDATWMHPKLAVPFARWLDTRFAIWCDLQIDSLIRGSHPHYDRLKERDRSACSHRVVSEVLRLVRLDAGKETQPYHYQNEARLLNWALSGEFKALDRESLGTAELALLANLSEYDAVLLGRGIEYDARKQKLLQFARGWREGQPHQMGRAA